MAGGPPGVGVIPTGKMGHDLHYRPLKMVSMNGFGWFSTDGSVRGVGCQNGGWEERGAGGVCGRRYTRRRPKKCSQMFFGLPIAPTNSHIMKTINIESFNRQLLLLELELRNSWVILEFPPPRKVSESHLKLAIYKTRKSWTPNRLPFPLLR